MLTKLKITAILYCTLLIISCAHQMSPSGGPDDKTGPSVLAVSPTSETVGVNSDSRIIFTFSEWISKRSEKSISIFPPLKFKTKIYRNRLEIIPEEKLADSTTYHIILTSGVQDLHNNPIPIPFNLIFSTGDALDSGMIAGCVLDPERKLLQPRVALFKSGEKADSGLTGPPTYLLQTDSTGQFSFSHIKTGHYTIIGFLDGNNDSRLQSSEQVYMPQDSVISITEQSKEIILYPALFDTAFPRITSLKASSSEIITAQWSKQFDSLVFSIKSFHIERSDTAITVESSKIISSSSTILTVIPRTPLKIAPYRCIYTLGKSFDTTTFTDTVLFNGVSERDTTRPSLLRSEPSGTNIDLLPELRLIWSEMVIFSDSVLLADSLQDSLWISASKNPSDTTTIRLPRRLQPGSTYRCVILSSSGSDLNNNSLQSRDSTDTVTVISFTTIEADSLATSIQGGASCLENEHQLTWVFKPVQAKSNRSFFSPNRGGQFYYDSIPAGRGTIGYFIDRNKNNIIDKGHLFPWIAPEPYAVSPDTIEARARWDIEGIRFPVCDPCRKIDHNGENPENTEPAN